MSIQYIYPTSTKAANTIVWGGTGGYSAFANDVNNGVTVGYNDSDYIYTNYGQLTNPTQPVSAIQFYMDDINIKPELMIFEARCKYGNYTNATLRDIILYNHLGIVVASSVNNQHYTSDMTWGQISPNNNHSSNIDYSNGFVTMNINNNNTDYSGLYLTVNVLASIWSYQPSFFISELDIIVSGATLLNNNCTLFIENYETINSGSNLHISGNYEVFGKTTLYIADIVYGSGNTDLYVFGASGHLNSGTPLHIQLCERDARLQPLYDNEISPSPTEVGYPGYQSSNSYQYNGIDGNTRWGFFSLLKDYQCTDKYHFAIDDYDNNYFFGKNIEYFYDGVSELMYIDYYSNYGVINGTYNTPYLSNAGFTILNDSTNNASGHLGYYCNEFMQTALFNNTQNNGYGYNLTLDLFNNNNSGIVFDHQNAIYMWFKIIDTGNSGDVTCLFDIYNNIAQYNQPYMPYNDFSVFYAETDKRLYVYTDNNIADIAWSITTNEWHLLCMNITRHSTSEIEVLTTIDGNYQSSIELNYDNTNGGHAYDGKAISIGQHHLYSNVGNISFITDKFAYTDKLVDPQHIYELYSPIARDTTNYFDYLGCKGYTEYYCTNNCIDRFWGDSDYIYSQPPLHGDEGWHYPSQNYIYFYDGYNNLNTVYETHNIVDFHSRGLNLIYGPYDTYLRFRADIDTPFKVKNIYVYDENNNVLSSKSGTVLLDGYGTCGPYEVQLDTPYFSSGQFHPSKTRIYAEFYVDTGCLNFVRPTGLVQASQQDTNFRRQWRNLRTRSVWNGFFQSEYYESGYGIVNNHISASYTDDPYTNHDNYHADNGFGYEYSGISDTTHDKWLGIKLQNYDILQYSGYTASIYYYVYGNQESGLSYISQGYINISTNPQVNLSSGDVTYWSQLPDNLNYESGFQIGFNFTKDNFYNAGGSYESIDIELSEAPFIYIDTTNKGVSRLGQIKLTQLDVAFEIPCIPTGINDIITLYTAGVANTGMDMPLYTSGMPHGYGYGTLFTKGSENDNFSLYVRGGLSDNMPLYINGFGGTSTQGITLFIKADDSGINYGSTNNTETLYIQSIPLTSGDCFDLFIAGPDSGYIYETFPITIEGYGDNTSDITNLYIQALESGIDYGSNNLSLDLYLNAIAFNSGDPFSLYIGAPSSGYMNSDMPLYLNNLNTWTSLNSGTSLYVRTLESGNTGLNSPTLFLKTDESFSLSGDPFNLYISGYVGKYNNSSTLFIDGQGHFENTIPLFLSVAYESSSNFNLFTAGWGSSGNKLINLYINGYGGSSINTTTLYTYGPPPFSGNMPLFIEGGGTDFRTSDTTLYTYNSPDNDFINSINLYVKGGFEISELPLLVYNEYIPLISNKSATLFTNAFSGVLGKIGDGSTLYIDGTKPNDYMNLYLHNSGIHSLYGTYPLYLGGKDITYSGTANETTLYVNNQSEHINYGCDLSLYATQAYNDSGTFNLFIARNSEAIAGNTNLYLSATNGDTAHIGMSISGATYSNNNINLSIPYVESVVINNAKLYTHGF